MDLNEDCTTCPFDCGDCIRVNDTICSEGENCENAPNDCGVCQSNAEGDDSNSNSNSSTKKNSDMTIYIIVGSVAAIGLVSIIVGAVVFNMKKGKNVSKEETI